LHGGRLEPPALGATTPLRQLLLHSPPVTEPGDRRLAQRLKSCTLYDEEARTVAAASAAPQECGGDGAAVPDTLVRSDAPGGAP
jgi:hypothetical protein